MKITVVMHFTSIGGSILNLCIIHELKFEKNVETMRESKYDSQYDV